MEQDHIIQTDSELSIADLITAPLEAAAQAQFALAKNTADFISEVGFEKDYKGNERIRTVRFEMTPPGNETASLSVQAPLIAVVPIPSLALEEVTVQFQMEVNSATKTTENASGGNTHAEVSVKGKVSSDAANTRETNQSAKYQIQVKAKKQEPTEALSRLLDVLASTVTPQTTETEGA
ncbi:MAG: DUF2589 domain-containing protein [Treponema sp.]|nr:DUF2589 domain-containing protein [Treponema sp.]